MTLQELNDTVQYLLIGLGMFVIATYLVFVMFGAFNESRKTHNTQVPSTTYEQPLICHWENDRSMFNISNI